MGRRDEDRAVRYKVDGLAGGVFAPSVRSKRLVNERTDVTDANEGWLAEFKTKHGLQS